jgi:hypothetical protein
MYEKRRRSRKNEKIHRREKKKEATEYITKGETNIRSLGVGLVHTPCTKCKNNAL